MSARRKKGPKIAPARWRSVLVLVGLAACAAALEARVLYLQFVSQDFLEEQGENRHLRTVQISAHRGSITDRHGEPIAVSTPVDSVWVNPQELVGSLDRLGELAAHHRVEVLEPRMHDGEARVGAESSTTRRYRFRILIQCEQTPSLLRQAPSDAVRPLIAITVSRDVL